MNLCGVARALVDMAFDAVEALMFALDDPAERVFGDADRLADKEAEEEVAEPQCDCCDVFIPGVHRFNCPSRKTSSLATTSAGDDPSPCSASTPGVEQGEAPNLTPRDLYDAATALRAKARESQDPQIAAEWGRIAARFDTAFCNAIKK